MNVKYYVRALLCLYITILLSIYNVHAQALKVGDTLPEELWSMPLQVVNHPEGKETITLSEYKDKLIILDFWATWCSPCVAMLPKQDSLQRQFADKIQIIPATYQSAEEVNNFMEKYTKRKGIHISLTEVVNNQSLKTYFEHGTIPHYIWVKNGIVKAITGSDEVTPDKIYAVLNDQKVSIKAKSNSPRLGYISGKASLLEFLSLNKPEQISDFNFQTSLSRYIPGLGAEINIVKPTKESPSFRITITNLSLLHLYQFAYGEGLMFTNPTNIIIETRDSLAVTQLRSVTDFTAWKQSHAYCFELVIPEARFSDAYQIFRDQLTMLFPQYNVVVESRTGEVLALERLENISLKNSTAAKFKQSYDGFTYHFSGGPPLSFVKVLNALYLYGISMPVVDMTGIEYKIDLELRANMSNVGEINDALKNYGLVLREKSTSIPFLIIKDKY